jgi:hypothetical protein
LLANVAPPILILLERGAAAKAAMAAETSPVKTAHQNAGKQQKAYAAPEGEVANAKKGGHHGIPERHDGIAEDEDERASEDDGHADVECDTRGAMAWTGHGSVIVEVHHHKNSL